MVGSNVQRIALLSSGSYFALWSHCVLVQVIIDTLHLLPKTNRYARLLYDDVCDPTSCTAVEPMVMGPALAVCDLQAAGLIEPLSGFYRGDRQWALYRLGPSARAFKRKWINASSTRGGGSSDKRPSPSLPCSPRCRMRWGSIIEGAHNVSGEHRSKRWRGAGEKLFHGVQKEIRSTDCSLA
jgi:hypothetical protein